MKTLFKSLAISFSITPIIFSFACANKQSYKPIYVTNGSLYNKDVIELLDKKIKSKLVDGNFHLLNGISIVNKLENGDDAQFDIKSREIFISSNNLRSKSKLSNETLSEYIFQLIYHEYNHFLNSLYLNNLEPNDPELNTSIYSKNKKNADVWNDSFLKEFKRILKYDINSKLYSSKNIYKNFVSLGSVYNQKNLFDMANYKNKDNYSLLKGNEVMSSINHDQNIPINNKHIITSSSLSYLYSMQELVARKMQIINMNYEPFTTKYGDGFDQNGWIFDKDLNKTRSPYLQDIVNYQGGMHSNDLYLQDKPTQELSQLYSDYVNSNTHVRHISFKNELRKSIIKNNFEGDIDNTKISFSGTFFKQAQVGYIDEGKFIMIPTNWNIFNGNYNYYTDYFDYKNILEKNLAFKYENKITFMSTVRSRKQGIVTTYDSINSNKNNLKVIELNEKIIIKKI